MLFELTISWDFLRAVLLNTCEFCVSDNVKAALKLAESARILRHMTGRASYNAFKRKYQEMSVEGSLGEVLVNREDVFLEERWSLSQSGKGLYLTVFQ